MYYYHWHLKRVLLLLQEGDKVVFTEEEVKKKMKDKGYILDNFLGINEYHDFVDEDGYKYHVQLNNFLRKENFKGFEIFHVHNIYTLDNIRHYIKINNLNVELLSTKYYGGSYNLQFQCVCGNTFERTWANFSHKRKHFYCCEKCRSKLKSGAKNKNKNMLSEVLKELRIEPIIPLSPNRPVSDKIDLIDDEGFLYYYKIQNLYNLQKRRVKDGLDKVVASNPYAIYNVNNYFKKLNGEFECISKKYTRNTQKLEILHKECGTVFKMPWVDLQDMFKRNREGMLVEHCPCCRKHKRESYHASVLKQVFMHEYPDTVLEESGCINPLTNYSLPTDIVNHRLKIAIEIQSSRHDNEYQQIKDKIKKEYWQNKGYTFYDPDIRDYNVLELIQLFFPSISEIPKYINIKFSESLDCPLIQNYLDKGWSIKNIAQQLGVRHSAILSAICDKRVTLPQNYKEDVLNWIPVVQLDFDGNLLREFCSIGEANRQGFTLAAIQRVLYSGQPQYKNSYWIKKRDYEQGNYFIPDYNHQIDRVTKDGEIIKSYKNIDEVQNELMFDMTEVKKALCFSKTHRYNGEYWIIHK